MAGQPTRHSSPDRLIVDGVSATLLTFSTYVRMMAARIIPWEGSSMQRRIRHDLNLFITEAPRSGIGDVTCREARWIQYETGDAVILVENGYRPRMLHVGPNAPEQPGLAALLAFFLEEAATVQANGENGA